MNRWLCLAVLMTTSSALAAPTADHILRKSDEIRNPQFDYTSFVTVSNFHPKKKTTSSTFRCRIKGRDKSLIETLTPLVDRGRLLLMNGSNFWAYLPNVSKPLRISHQEKLTGEVANGDLARANFSGDYTPTLKETRTIKSQKFYVLDLKANSEDVTYGRAVLMVNAQNFRPHSAEFYAFSGRLLKTCTYEDYKPLGGMVRPAKLTMRDAVEEQRYSVLELTEMTVAPLPDKYFNKENLKRTGQ